MKKLNKQLICRGTHHRLITGDKEPVLSTCLISQCTFDCLCRVAYVDVAPEVLKAFCWIVLPGPKLSKLVGIRDVRQSQARDAHFGVVHPKLPRHLFAKNFRQGIYVASLSLFALRTSHHEQVVELSGMAQFVGYAGAALGPVLFGFFTPGYW
ncbi:hypothetical protein [Paraburkholderia dipogonis]|uniref:hypothetical protein n=1 Tax=Paraburkholderia dipogonis TaxID=1211383 RepID=UPI001AD808A5|nr:hypothetical protein [Paraburkholderia dipogonis]